jgi:three-Cys-motif partner protein
MDIQDGFKADEIGYWSEVKLDIIRKYATAYSTVLCSNKQKRFYHVYIDGFSGAGVHVSKMTQESVPGSPVNALEVCPPFKEYHFIDMNSRKIEALRKLVADRTNVYLYDGDCNSILLKKVYPQVTYDQYRRGLCLLDPYGLHLTWEVVKTAGQMKSLEIFLNFPVMDMNRNVLWRNQDDARIRPEDVQRMNAFWGDESWRNVAYSPSPQTSLFGETELKKETNETIAEGYRDRLKKVAGFKHVPAPMPMRNSTGAIVYYLFFATQNSTGLKIVENIFDKYRLRGKL